MKRPLAAFGISYFGGLLAAAVLPPAVFVLPTAFLVILFCFNKYQRQSTGAVILLSAGMLTAVLFHLFYVGIFVVPVQHKYGSVATVLAEVESSESSYIDGMSRGTLLVREQDGKDESFRVFCSAFPESEVGDLVKMELSLVPLEEESALQYYTDETFIGGEYYGDYQWLGESKRLIYRCRKLQRTLSYTLRKNLTDEVGGIAAAMVVGDKTKLSDTTKSLFRRAGTSHLLVVSGLHLAMVCGFAWMIGSRKFQYFRLRAIFSMILVFLLMALTGFTPSVCRAGIVALLYYLAVLCMRPPDALTSFAVAAIIMGTQNCYAVCDIGLQLSFSASAGIIFCASLMQMERRPIKSESFWKTKMFSVFSLVQTAVMASLFTLPVLLLQNLSVSGVGAISNLATLWLAQPILLFGYLSIIFGLLPPLQILYWGTLAVMAACIRILVWTTALCAALPFSHVVLPREYTCMVWLILAGIVFAAFQTKQFRWLLFSLPACFVVSISAAVLLKRNTVDILLVGNRSNPCVVLTENGHASVLFRGGEINVAAVWKCLDAQSISKIDTWIDLRRDAASIKILAERQIIMEESGNMEIMLLPDVSVQLLHTLPGNLAVLDIEGFQLGITTGKPLLQRPVMLDMFFPGNSLPELIDCQRVILTTQNFSWLDSLENACFSDAEIQYGTSPEILIRPGKSLICLEVEQYDNS